LGRGELAADQAEAHALEPSAAILDPPALYARSIRSSFDRSCSINARTSRRMSSSAARASGEIFLFAILVVLSEKLVELLLDPHQRQDDRPDDIGAQLVAGHASIFVA